MAEGAGFSGRYANKPLPDVSGVRLGLKLLLVSAGIIVVGESLPTARRPAAVGKSHDERKRFGLLLTAFSCTTWRDRLAKRKILEMCFREARGLARYAR